MAHKSWLMEKEGAWDLSLPYTLGGAHKGTIEGAVGSFRGRGQGRALSFQGRESYKRSQALGRLAHLKTLQTASTFLKEAASKDKAAQQLTPSLPTVFGAHVPGPSTHIPNPESPTRQGSTTSGPVTDTLQPCDNVVSLEAAASLVSPAITQEQRQQQMAAQAIAEGDALIWQLNCGFFFF